MRSDHTYRSCVGPASRLLSSLLLPSLSSPPSSSSSHRSLRADDVRLGIRVQRDASRILRRHPEGVHATGAGQRIPDRGTDESRVRREARERKACADALRRPRSHTHPLHAAVSLFASAASAHRLRNEFPTHPFLAGIPSSADVTPLQKFNAEQAGDAK